MARDTNRGHTVAAVGECFHLAKDAGFKVGRCCGAAAAGGCLPVFTDGGRVCGLQAALHCLPACCAATRTCSPEPAIHLRPSPPLPCRQVSAHMLPDLPNVGWERDIESFREFFENPAFRTGGRQGGRGSAGQCQQSQGLSWQPCASCALPLDPVPLTLHPMLPRLPPVPSTDGLKLYPTLVIRGTGLYELWKKGLYRNYAPDKVGSRVTCGSYYIVPRNTQWKGKVASPQIRARQGACCHTTHFLDPRSWWPWWPASWPTCHVTL